MSSKSSRKSAPRLVVSNARAAVGRPKPAKPNDEPVGSYVRETLLGTAEWHTPEGPLARIDVSVVRHSGDPELGTTAQHVPCYNIQLSSQVFPHQMTTYEAFAVPMHLGLQALGQLFLDLHARAEALNLPALGFDRTEDEARRSTHAAEA